MNTTLKKKLAVSVLSAAAAPALLFLGAGTAQASIGVLTHPGALGVAVTVYNNSNTDLGWCTYTATPLNSPLLPYVSFPFKLEANQSFTLDIPGIETGTQWAPSVSCSNGGQQPTFPGAITY